MIHYYDGKSIYQCGNVPAETVDDVLCELNENLCPELCTDENTSHTFFTDLVTFVEWWGSEDDADVTVVRLALENSVIYPFSMATVYDTVVTYYTEDSMLGVARDG